MRDPRDIAAALPAPRDLALFLDIDGTLIGPHQIDRERGIGASRVDLVRRLSELTGDAVTILTGRAVESADAILAPLVLPAAGMQGSDRRFADGRRVMPVLTAEDRRLFEVLAAKMGERHPAVFVEWKPAGMALVHDENTDASEAIMALARSVVGARWEVMPGRVAIDIVPKGNDKGRALAAFMERRPCVGRVPVHVGDDFPDHPAFVAADKAGGYGIAIGSPVPGVLHHLRDHEDVWALLEAYAERWL